MIFFWVLCEYVYVYQNFKFFMLVDKSKNKGTNHKINVEPQDLNLQNSFEHETWRSKKTCST